MCLWMDDARDNNGVYFLLALAFGPQLGSGFSGNLASFWIRDGGLASFRTEKLASILIYTHTQT